MTEAENKFRKEAYETVNYYRQKHGAPPLEVDSEIQKYAQEWADKIAASGSISHRSNPKYGENLYMAGGPGQTGKKAIEFWYREMANFNFKKPDFTPNSGHFSQLVWKSCQKMGIGVKFKGEKVIMVANFEPPGNMMGQFAENVSPKSS